MIPFLLAAVGGYLIGQSRKDEQYADGGMMADGAKIKHYIEKVNWNNLSTDWNEGDNDGYIYGINYLDIENEGERGYNVIDVEWFKTEEEREKAISELENVTII